MKIKTEKRLSRSNGSRRLEARGRGRHSIRNKATYYCRPATE